MSSVSIQPSTTGVVEKQVVVQPPSSTNENSSESSKRRQKKFYDNQTTHFFTSQSRAFTSRLKPATLVETRKEASSEGKPSFVKQVQPAKSKPVSDAQKRIVRAPTKSVAEEIGIEFVSEEELSRVKKLAEEKFQIDLNDLFINEQKAGEDLSLVDPKLTNVLHANHVDNLTDYLDVIVLPIFSKHLIDFATHNLSLIKQWEYIIDKLLLSEEDEVSFAFPPAKTGFRLFEHNITDYYKIISRGQDAEPNRRVVITRKKSESRRPIILLSDLIQNSERYQLLEKLLKEREERLTNEELEKRAEKIRLVEERKQMGEPVETDDGFTIVSHKKTYETRHKKKQPYTTPIQTESSSPTTPKTPTSFPVIPTKPSNKKENIPSNSFSLLSK